MDGLILTMNWPNDEGSISTYLSWVQMRDGFIKISARIWRPQRDYSTLSKPQVLALGIRRSWIWALGRLERFGFGVRVSFKDYERNMLASMCNTKLFNLTVAESWASWKVVEFCEDL